MGRLGARRVQVGRFVPDVAVTESKTGRLLAIGEAKRWDDIDSEHTGEQLGEWLCESQIPICLAMSRGYRERMEDRVEIATGGGTGESDLHLRRAEVVDKENGHAGVVEARTMMRNRLEDRTDGHRYQKEGVESLQDLEYAGILHEQGLGKTKIGLGVALYWLRSGAVTNVLAITKNIIETWREEVEKHTRLEGYVIGRNPARHRTR